MASQINKALLIIVCIALLGGCAIFRQEPIYLTDRHKTWIIPKGEAFNAIGDDGRLAQRKALDDLVVLYKGRLLSLEKEADLRVLRAEKKGNKKGIFAGAGALIASAVGAWFIKKKKKKNG